MEKSIAEYALRYYKDLYDLGDPDLALKPLQAKGLWQVYIKNYGRRKNLSMPLMLTDIALVFPKLVTDEDWQIDYNFPMNVARRKYDQTH